MRIALWQGPSPAGDAEQGIAVIEAALKGAGALGAATLVAPEVFLPGYNHDRIRDLAQERGGEWHVRLATACRAAGCGLVIGYAERDGGTCFNAAIAFGPDGAEIAHYRKIQLYGARERSLYGPGDAYCTFDLAGTKAAILICYDVEFAPHVAALAREGVGLILVPTANMVPFAHVMARTVPAMAANHGVAIAYANFCGSEGDLTYLGGSVIAGPHGEIVAQAGEGPTLLVADLPAPDPARLATQLSDLRTIRP